MQRQRERAQAEQLAVEARRRISFVQTRLRYFASVCQTRDALLSFASLLQLLHKVRAPFASPPWSL
jgi:hypothetical protein